MKLKNTTGEKDSVIAITILLILLFLVFKSRSWIYAALTVAVISLLSDLVTFYLHKIWTVLTEILGRISGGIILSLVFIFILMPTALLKNWFGKKDIILNRKNISSSFETRNHKYSQSDLDNPW